VGGIGTPLADNVLGVVAADIVCEDVLPVLAETFTSELKLAEP
jgi:hypothetical protein